MTTPVAQIARSLLRDDTRRPPFDHFSSGYLGALTVADLEGWDEERLLVEAATADRALLRLQAAGRLASLAQARGVRWAIAELLDLLHVPDEADDDDLDSAQAASIA